MVDSLIPIITKCNPKHFIDIEEVRSMLADQILNDLSAQKVNKLSSYDEFESDQISNIQDEDDRLQALEEAMQEFALKLEIFDPLDREIFNEDEEN